MHDGAVLPIEISHSIVSAPSTSGPFENPCRPRLPAAISDASALLYHAVESGREVPRTVRKPIVRLAAALSKGTAIGSDDEEAFLEAYAHLVILVAPVTAVTLRATSRVLNRPTWWAKLLRFGPVSETQTFSSYFGLLALVLVVMIGAAEW